MYVLRCMCRWMGTRSHTQTWQTVDSQDLEHLFSQIAWNHLLGGGDNGLSGSSSASRRPIIRVFAKRLCIVYTLYTLRAHTRTQVLYQKDGGCLPCVPCIVYYVCTHQRRPNLFFSYLPFLDLFLPHYISAVLSIRLAAPPAEYLFRSALPSDEDVEAKRQLTWEYEYIEMHIPHST